MKTGHSVSDFSKIAADFFFKQLEALTDPLVVLPTGNTPLGMYACLIADYADRRDVWDRMRFLALDEYLGLQKNDPRLFSGWLRRVFLDPIGIDDGRCTLFQSDVKDPVAEAARIESWLKDNGPIDLAVLGLGTNGHIAFNEPGTRFDQSAQMVTLTQDSIQANAAYWGGVDHVPHTALTLGLGDLVHSRHTILLVNGAHKADILGRVLHGPVTTDIPATYLRTIPNVTIITDRAALPLPP